MATRVDTKQDLSEREFSKLAEMVYDHCGIDLREGKRDLVRARLAKQMRVGKFASPQEYLQHVTADTSGEEFRGLIDAMSTNLTSFFRENSHFDYLNTSFLPAMLKNKQELGQNVIRAWSAGCSSGEEAYSLAMTLLEATGGGAGWDIKLLASDISTRVLAAARRGCYGENRIASIPPMMRGKYFSGGAAGYEPLPQVKQMIAFRH